SDPLGGERAVGLTVLGLVRFVIDLVEVTFVEVLRINRGHIRPPLPRRRSARRRRRAPPTRLRRSRGEGTWWLLASDRRASGTGRRRRAAAQGSGRACRSGIPGWRRRPRRRSAAGGS